MPPVKAKLGVLTILGVSAATTACWSTVFGSGNEPPAALAAESEAPAENEEALPPSAPSGAPAEIEALFSAPAGNVSVSANRLGGVWSTSFPVHVEHRIAIAADSITLAARCRSTGQIVHVKAAARVTDQSIEFLESKATSLVAGFCHESFWVSPSKRAACWMAVDGDPVGDADASADSSVDVVASCFSLDGTRLRLKLDGIDESSWIKVSD
jgi:hypothetical protein